MPSIAGSNRPPQPPDRLLDWPGEALERVPEPAASQEPWPLKGPKAPPADPPVLPDPCAFLENALGHFMALEDPEREVWLQEAGARGGELGRFAAILQDLRQRRMGWTAAMGPAWEDSTHPDPQASRTARAAGPEGSMAAPPKP